MELGADDEQLAVYLRDRGGEAPALIGEFAQDCARLPVRSQPHRGDHGAEIPSGDGAPVRDTIEQVAVQQHPVGVEVIPAKIDRPGRGAGRICPPERAALALGSDQQQRLSRMAHDPVEVRRIRRVVPGEIDRHRRLPDLPWTHGQPPHDRMLAVGHVGPVAMHDHVVG
ncbi:MAG TPA: hypothetical protein VF482_01550 [Trebonia sp.]